MKIFSRRTKKSGFLFQELVQLEKSFKNGLVLVGESLDIKIMYQNIQNKLIIDQAPFEQKAHALDLELWVLILETSNQNLIGLQGNFIQGLIVG